jgi:hypothetical protein
VFTTFAVLFAILALSNLSKPLHLDPNAGFVFFGVKTHGVANAILGPAFGFILLFYAFGLWRMRRWVMPLAAIYALYVIVNLSLFSIRNPASSNESSAAFMLIYIAVAVGVSTGSAILLYRRRALLA